MFGSEVQSSDSLPPAASQAPIPQGGEATGVFSRPPAPAAQSGPGEFTQMFGAPSPPKPIVVKAQASPAPAPAAPKLPKKSNLALILILGGLFLLVVIVVLIFVLTR